MTDRSTDWIIRWQQNYLITFCC